MRFQRIVLLFIALALPVTAVAQATGETEEERRIRILNNLMVSANKSYGDRDLVASIDSLNKVLSIDAQYAPAYFLKGKIYIQQKEYEKAAENINQAITLDPENLKYNTEIKNIIRLNLNDGNTAFRRGNYDEAKEMFGNVLKLDPNYTSAHYGLGTIAKKKRDYKNAIIHFSRAIDSDSTYVRAWFGRGQAHQFNRQYDEALRDYEETVRLDSTIAVALVNMGVIEYSRKKYNRVIELTQRAIKADPKNAKAYRNQGIAYAAKNDWAKAVELQKMAVTLTQKDWQVYFRLAEASNNTGKCEDAKWAAEKGTKLRPKDGGLYVELGTALKCLGLEDEAIAAFQTAKRDSKWRQVAEYNIDMILNKDKYEHAK